MLAFSYDFVANLYYSIPTYFSLNSHFYLQVSF